MCKSVLLAVLIFCGSLVTNAQTCNPNDPYDQIVSDFHSTIARRQDGTLVVWGENKASDGRGDILSPQVIDSVNYPGLTGKPLKAALGSMNLRKTQAILLTTTGLFVWGSPNLVISNMITANYEFRKIAVEGKADGLPPGVRPGNVKIMTATFGGLAIVTDSGEVWTLGRDRYLFGDDSPDPDKWHQVVSSVSPYPKLKNIVQLRISPRAVIAVDSSNIWYTWGYKTFTGSGGPTVRSRATIMEKPLDYSGGLPKMIGVTSRGSGAITAYFVLSPNGNLYSMGDNYKGILGIGPTNALGVWNRVRKNSSENLENVTFISVQEHDAQILAAAAITSDNNLWAWGENDHSNLGAPASPSYILYPRTPDGFTYNVDKANYAEMGGHTLVYVKDGHDRYCYVGHRINGSMGDGSATDAVEVSMNCTNTASVPSCSFCPKTANNKIGSNQDICKGSEVSDLKGTLATLSNEDELTYHWLSSSSENTGYTMLVSENEVDLENPKVNQTTWFRRMVKNTTQDCPGDTSNPVQIAVHEFPDIPVITATSEVCLGDSIVLSTPTLQDATYNWIGPDGFNSYNQRNVIYNAGITQAGTYKLGVIGKFLCISDFATVDVNVHTFDLQIATDTNLCEGETVTLSLINSEPEYIYTWTDPKGFSSSEKNPVLEELQKNQSGKYTVVVSDTILCKDSLSFMLQIDSCSNPTFPPVVPPIIAPQESFSIPEGFSPNNDGVNDVFTINGLSAYPNNSIVIFNRWGQKVYAANPYHNNWKGENMFGLVVTGSDKQLPEGTYFYLLEKNNGEAPVKGSIYLKK